MKGRKIKYIVPIILSIIIISSCVTLINSIKKQKEVYTQAGNIENAKVASDNVTIQKTMDQVFSDIGRYNFNVAMGTNTAYGDSSYISSAASEAGVRTAKYPEYICKPLYLAEYGTGYLTESIDIGYKYISGTSFDMSETVKSVIGGGGNSSKSELKDNGGNIKAAYLVVSATTGLLTRQTNSYGTDTQYELPRYPNLLNTYPMTLIGPKGDSITPQLTLYQDEAGLRTSGYVDVTEFIKEQGYGEYIGKDIPYLDIRPILNELGQGVGVGEDKFASWKLIVIEENEKNDIKSINLKLGGMQTKGTTQDKINVQINRPGVTIKKDNPKGQLLISVEGTEVSGKVTFNNNPLTGANREDGKFFIAQPQINEQIIDMEKYPVIRGGYEDYNTDFILADISTEEKPYINAVLPEGNTNVDMEIVNNEEATVFLVNALGLSSDIEIPIYTTEITHEPSEGFTELLQGGNVDITLKVTNTSIEELSGLHEGKTYFSIDEDILIDNSTAKLYFTNEKGEKIELPSSMYEINGNQVSINFGENSDAISQKGEYITFTITGRNKVKKENYISTSYTDGKLITEDGEKVEVLLEKITSGSDQYNVKENYLQDITINKIWEDNEIQAQRRPESLIMILKGNNQTIEKELTKDNLVEGTNNKWSIVIEDLQKYDENGKEIEYTVEEKEKNTGDLDFYTTQANKVKVTNNQATITNTFTEPTEKVSIEVTKIWDDQENIYNKRPESIEIEIKNGEIVKANKVITKEENWEYKFTNLEKYDENGQEIKYTVSEKEVKENDLYNYTAEIGEITNKTGTTNEKEVTIKNKMTKIPGTVVVKYIDKNTGEEISTNIVKEGVLGESFDITSDEKEIPGYTLVEKPEEMTGKYEEKAQEKIFYYAKTSQVRVKYLEKGSNKVLSQEKIIYGHEGLEYKTIKEEIQGYTFIEDTKNTSGKMAREEIEVIYYYAKNTNVIVKYLDKETGENLAEQYEIQGYVGKEYETEQKQIEGYTFIEDTKNTTGKMTEDTIEVIYYYGKNTQIVVKYLEKDSNTPLEKEIIINGYEGKEYKTEQKDIENYEFIEIVGNGSGTMPRKPIEIIYYYAQKTKATVQHIDRETGKILKEETKEGKVGDIFETHPENFEGYILVESPQNPNITMTKEEQIIKYYYAHISAGVIEKHIDEITGEVIYEEVHEGNEGDYYNIPSKEFNGYDLVTEDEEGNSKLPENAEGEMTKEVIEVKYYYIKKATVKVEYIDETTGEKLTTDIIIEGHQNDEYTTEEKEFEGYKLVETPENAKGTMTITKNEDGTYNTETIVTYYYKKQAGGVTEKHIDINTNEILEEKIHEGNVGDDYNIPSKEFKGYDLVTQDEQGNNKLPENAIGKMTEEPIEVTYYYIKKATVKVEYIDKQTGEKITEDEIIEGHEGDSYQTEEKEFDGYDIVEIPSNSTGEMKDEIIVTYYYKKKAEVDVKYIEKDSEKEIAESEKIEGYIGDDYKTEQKEIPYYKFVEKTENYEGKMEEEKTNVIYYYEKQIFNLSVDKWVSNVNIDGINKTAQNIENKDEIYKVDIHRTKTQTANVKITYKIRITNKGEIEGKVGEIVEKIPQGYVYNQQDNEIHWEERDGTLVTDVLKDEIIRAGEYKEIEIVLTWNKGNNNFGEKENTVILNKLENPAGFEDINQADNTSKSKMLLSIATGLERNDRIIIIGIVQIVLAISIGLLISYKKKEKTK